MWIHVAVSSDVLNSFLSYHSWCIYSFVSFKSLWEKYFIGYCREVGKERGNYLSPKFGVALNKYSVLRHVKRKVFDEEVTYIMWQFVCFLFVALNCPSKIIYRHSCAVWNVCFNYINCNLHLYCKVCQFRG